MSRDHSDKALDFTNSLKHHDISINVLIDEINHKLSESMITCEQNTNTEINYVKYYKLLI